MVRLACTEDRNLGNAISMRDVVLNEHLAESVCWGQCINISVIVIRTNFCNDGDKTGFIYVFAFVIASFDDREP
jgi:hypothetical protein